MYLREGEAFMSIKRLEQTVAFARDRRANPSAAGTRLRAAACSSCVRYLPKRAERNDVVGIARSKEQPTRISGTGRVCRFDP